MSRKCANQPPLEATKLADVTLRLPDGTEYQLKGACIAAIEISDINARMFHSTCGDNWLQSTPFPGGRKNVRCEVELSAREVLILEPRRRKR